MREVNRLPGVSAEDLVAVVDLHLDRVHDAVRRLGCDPRAAVEVVETSALDLVDAVAERPQTVPDAVGWWLHAARRLGMRVGRASASGSGTVHDPLPVGGGVLAADDDQVLLSEALEELPERERAALLLRDSYDLPAVSVAAALGTDTSAAMDLVGRARLAFVSRADDEPVPPVPAHASPLGVLARLGEDTPVAPHEATARRHAGSCPGCAAVVDAQRRAHLLLAGLTVVALSPDDRAAVLERVEDHAVTSLPLTASLLVMEEDEWDEEEQLSDRWFSPLLATLGVVLAVLVGIGVGVAIDRLDAPTLDRRQAAVSVLPPVTAPPVLSPAPGSAPTRAPEAPVPPPRVFEIPPPTPSAPPPPAEATVRVDPASGPSGAVLTVTGTGWLAGGEVTVDYLRADGTPTGSTVTASADERGAFRAQLAADDPAAAQGRHVVRASDGTSASIAPYDVVD